MNGPVPMALQAQDGVFYRLGEQLRHSGPEIVQAAQDPAVLALGGTAMAGLAVGALAAPKLAGATTGLAHKALYAEPGGVLLGYARGRWGITYPVYLSLLDRLMHAQAIAPTGGAKTSLFEWLYYQDLKSGLTCVCIENLGNFGHKAVSRAMLAGKPVHLFDPTVKNTLKWNPLSGPAEQVAERAVSTFESSDKSGKEQFFKSFQASLLRHVILALKAYERRLEREVHMGDVWSFLNDPAFRNHVLDTSGDTDEKGRVRVEAPHLPKKTRKYFEGRYFGAWSAKQRDDHTAGLFSAIDTLLGPGVVEKALCPRPGEPTLDLATALDSGGLVLLSAPQDLLGETATRTLSTWLMMTLMQTIRGRGRGRRPISMFVDEAHSMLGHASSDAAREFNGFLTAARHYNTILQLSYQSFSLLPEELAGSLSTNARTKLIGGGLGPKDAKEAREIMGYAEEQVTDRRETYKGLMNFPGSHSVGTREMERPALSEQEVRLLHRGWWNVRRVKNGNDQKPVLVKAGRAPALAAEFEPERVLALAEPPDAPGGEDAGEGVVGRS